MFYEIVTKSKLVKQRLRIGLYELSCSMAFVPPLQVKVKLQEDQ